MVGDKVEILQVATEFLDAVNDAYLHQHIEFPTRHIYGQAQNTLDLAFCGPFY